MDEPEPVKPEESILPPEPQPEPPAVVQGEENASEESGEGRPSGEYGRKKSSAPRFVNILLEKPKLSWWEHPPIQYAFNHPHVRSKLEKLMGSNLVSLTDRNYMILLQERILEDYANGMDQRIIKRQHEEMERVKHLVLTGKIPLEEAPIEMANHPVMLIDQYCKKIMAERRAKLKILKPHIPKYLYWDDTPDPPPGLSIQNGHVLRKDNDRLCIPPEVFLSQEVSECIADGYMLTDEEFDGIKYESPLIKQLRHCESVEEMYALADEIIGILKTLADNRKVAAVEEKEDAD